MKKAKLLTLLLLFAFYVILTSCSDESGLGAPQVTKHPIGTFYKATGFWEYLPRGYGGAVPNPLIIFLHGLGENGSGSAQDLEKLKNNGIPMLVENGQWPNLRPFVILAFQQRSGCPTADQIHDYIEFAVNNYKIDSSRIYLTGLSCGAHGIDNYLAKYGSGWIAAAVPIAGSISEAWSAQACSLVQNVAVWSFFGDQDRASGYASNSQAMDNFAACSNRKDVRYTVYPGVGHDSWSRTYDGSAGHDIYSWMLEFSR